MNRYDRQQYLDINIAHVDSATHPICQLKYDGIWCGAEVSQAGVIEYYSRHGQVKSTARADSTFTSGLYIGELMFGSEWSKEENRSGKFYCFDLVETREGDHRNEPYLNRYSRLKYIFDNSPRKPIGWELAPTFLTHESLNIWKTLIEPGHYEGLVFRNYADNWHQPLLRAKYELTKDLYITGFVEGEGRLAGSLGALKASYSPVGVGPELTIGGGLSDTLRKQIWKNPDQFLGRCMVITAKKEFKSGLLRHPNFSHFHPEK